MQQIGLSIIIPTFNNGHSDSPDGMGTLTSSSSFVTINNATYNFTSIAKGGLSNAVFNITVSSSAAIGSHIDFVYHVSAGTYSAQRTYDKIVSAVVEDFETNDFSQYPWASAGGADWITTTENPFEGQYCSKSGSISDNQTSEMKVVMNVLSADTISFYKKVSSEATYDFLKFYIDGNKVGEWSGNTGWSRSGYPVTIGSHSFRWVYDKDQAASDGDDCAWVDFVVFPPSTPDGIAENESVDLQLSFYPNPFKDKTAINYTISKKTSVSLIVYNAFGQVVEIMRNNTEQSAGTYTSIFNSLGHGPGIYFCRLQSGNQSLIHKLILTK